MPADVVVDVVDGTNRRFRSSNMASREGAGEALREIEGETKPPPGGGRDLLLVSKAGGRGIKLESYSAMG